MAGWHQDHRHQVHQTGIIRPGSSDRVHQIGFIRLGAIVAAWVEQATTGRGYPDWEGANDGAAAAARLVPVFVELAPGCDVTAVLAAIAGAGGGVSPDEQDRLALDRATGQADAPLRLVAYVPRQSIAGLEAVPGIAIRHVGPVVVGPVVAGSGAHPANPPSAQGTDLRPPADSPVLAPIAAVVDDGIPFLAARFRRGLDATRFLSVWLQTDERQVAGAGVAGGLVLTAAEINRMLAVGEEQDQYRRINRRLLPVTERSSSNHRISHGAHVLEIAAGADPADSRDPMRGVALLAVQLPPAAVADTSGRRNEGRIVQAVRWIMLEALRANRGHGRSPLVITLSLGSLAGPGGDSQFLANWLAWEAAAWQRLTGCKMTLVCAYGNAHRQRLVARACVGRKAPMELTWRVLPDDHSPSFLELRCPKARAGKVWLTLHPPGNRVPPVTVGFDTATARVISSAGGPVAAVYPMAEQHHAALLIALAPTARLDGGAVAPAGAWQVTLTTSGGKDLVVTAKVQRDDTPAGYRRLGRQSWLDHPLAWDWDDQTRDWIKPWPGSIGPQPQPPAPVSRQGTAAAHAGASDPSLLFVGSVKPRIGYPDDRVSSLYSAEGVSGSATETCQPGAAPHQTGESRGPTGVALADDGSNLYGRLASGVLTGSTARISGTSVAAPAVARATVLALLTGGADPLPFGAVPTGLLRDPLQGFGVLAGQQPYHRGSELAWI